MTHRKRYPYSALPDGQFVRVWTDSTQPEYYYGRIKYHRRNDKGRPVGITAVETLDPRHLGDWYRRPHGWYREMGTEYIEPVEHLTEEPTKGSFICGHPIGITDEPRYCTETTVEGTDRCATHRLKYTEAEWRQALEIAEENDFDEIDSREHGGELAAVIAVMFHEDVVGRDEVKLYAAITVAGGRTKEWDREFLMREMTG
ncbi:MULTISPECIES: hypothetical protein [unclassified Streptomyces]|uniref:hypothetical protein n=1 Tax=unclassified Streptomyces TaxID=2593676 RepID=UPI002E2A73BB|nr:hypothetical protein [Streptomyces sp. NBC_00285]